jgi:hypothetical protein
MASRIAIISTSRLEASRKSRLSSVRKELVAIVERAICLYKAPAYSEEKMLSATESITATGKTTTDSDCNQ